MCVCVLICEAITTYSLSCLCLSSKSWFLQCSIWQVSQYLPSLSNHTYAVFVFVSYCWCKKSPQTQWLQATQMYYAQSWRWEGLKSKCWQLCPCWRPQESLCSRNCLHWTAPAGGPFSMFRASSAASSHLSSCDLCFLFTSPSQTLLIPLSL